MSKDSEILCTAITISDAFGTMELDIRNSEYFVS